METPISETRGAPLVWRIDIAILGHRLYKARHDINWLETNVLLSEGRTKFISLPTHYKQKVTENGASVKEISVHISKNATVRCPKCNVTVAVLPPLMV